LAKRLIIGWDFENYIYNTLRKKFSALEGWTIEEQSSTRNGLRPDFVVSKRVPYAVIEAKDKATLMPTDVDQVLNYKRLLKAKEAIIYIANDTYLPEPVWRYAKGWDVLLQRTRWRMKK
jgi:hypothetical protein